MTEIAARLPRPRGPLRALQLLVLAGGLALLAAGVAALRPQAHARTVQAATVSPRAHHAVVVRASAPAQGASTALAGDAARAFDRGLFVASPGGIVATAARVASWHRLIVRLTRGSGVSPALVEAVVLVESSGRSDVTAGSAAGLTQLQPREARSLGLRVKSAQSERLTRRIERAWNPAHARQLRGWRRRYDQRFAPAKSLAATIRYLRAARSTFGRADLAVASYHLGIGTVKHAVAAYGGEAVPSYAELYFGSAPDRHRAVWQRLDAAGAYYWKVLAAERVMRLYRTDASALSYEASLQARKNSAEEVLHPRYRTHQFATPSALAAAWRRHLLRAIPRSVARTHVAVTRILGQEAHALGRSRRLYAGLRPVSLDVLLYIGKRVHELSGARRLLVTSAVRDRRYQRVLMRVNANAARSYSLHTTGYAFDIARAYSTTRQAAAFQFVLDRLTAVGAIAYIREGAAIHIAVASDAQQRLRLLARS